MTLNIVIAEDHPLAAEGLQTMLQQQPGWHVIATVPDTDQLLQALSTHKPDVVVADVVLPGPSIFVALRERMQGPDRPGVVLVSGYWTFDRLSAALQFPGASILGKTDAPEMLIEAVRQAQHHKGWYSEDIRQILKRLDQDPVRQRLLRETFVDDEFEVLYGMRRGFTDEEIAGRLELDLADVDRHMATILTKLNLKSIEEFREWVLQMDRLILP